MDCTYCGERNQQGVGYCTKCGMKFVVASLEEQGSDVPPSIVQQPAYPLEYKLLVASLKKEAHEVSQKKYCNLNIH